MATYPSPDLWPSPLLFPGTEPLAQVAWAPTLEDVAAQAAAYTLQGLDEEQPEALDEDGGYLTFTEETRPNDRQVSLKIAAAIAEVSGRVGVARKQDAADYAANPTGLNAWGDLARQAAAWHVVMSIERERLGEQAVDVDGNYKSARDQYLGLLSELTRQARYTAPRLA